MISIKYFSLFSFVAFIFLDYLIRSNYLGAYLKHKYLNILELGNYYIVFIVGISTFLILMLFSYFGVNLIYFDYGLDTDLFNTMAESSGENNTSKTSETVVNITNQAEGNINLNHQKLHVSIPATTSNNLIAAGSAAAGANVALKAMQAMPGSPGVKAVSGASAMIITQAVAYNMGKLYNSNNPINHFTNLFDNFSLDGLGYTSHLNIDKYPDFPLNLLPGIDQIITGDLVLLFIILNIFIVNYITRLDYNKYLPENKLGNILKFIINRYITMYSKSSQFLLYFCWVFLFLSIISLKIFMYYIMNS